MTNVFQPFRLHQLPGGFSAAWLAGLLWLSAASWVFSSDTTPDRQVAEKPASGASSDTAQGTQQQQPPTDDPYGVNKVPDATVGIGVDSKTGTNIDFNLPFRDHKNNLVRVGDCFDGVKPIILSFNYSDCPKLCSVQLENMVDTLRQVRKFRIGTDFDMVSVSIDPSEKPATARANIDKYSNRYNSRESIPGFRFLVGDYNEIKTLANQCGFRYKYVPEQDLFSHPPVFILVSPKGKIVRYIHGLDYDPLTMERALIETAAGKIGSPINYLSYGILNCFTFDEKLGKYTVHAKTIMRVAAGLTLVLLCVTLTPYWFFKRGAQKRLSESSKPEQTIESNSPVELDGSV